MSTEPACVKELGRHLAGLGWVSDLWVAGSLASGDYVPGVSDIDLVAVADGPVDSGRITLLTALHRELDHGVGSGFNLGCVYVDAAHLPDAAANHPRWTHGSLVRRRLSGIERAELSEYGYAVLGRPPQAVLAPMGSAELRQAVREELAGYWTKAVRHPWWWLDPVMPDLGLTAMARARHAFSTGYLLDKTQAIEEADAPEWYLAQMRARRRGDSVVSPRLRSAVIAWSDARRTIAEICNRADRSL